MVTIERRGLLKTVLAGAGGALLVPFAGEAATTVGRSVVIRSAPHPTHHMVEFTMNDGTVFKALASDVIYTSNGVIFHLTNHTEGFLEASLDSFGKIITVQGYDASGRYGTIAQTAKLRSMAFCGGGGSVGFDVPSDELKARERSDWLKTFKFSFVKQVYVINV